MRLILASTSPARRALMDGLGVAYEAVSPGVDETVASGTSAMEAVAELARRKSSAVSRPRLGAIVIGADQLVSFEDRTLGKPANRDEARTQLRGMAGRRHQLVTGVCVTDGARRWEAVETTTVSLYPCEPDALERYLDLEEWKGCAGGYRIEGRGQALIAAIDGDRTNVQGLPMLALVRLLREAGVTLI